MIRGKGMMRAGIVGLGAVFALSGAAVAQERQVDVNPYLGVDQVVLAPIKGDGDVLTYTNIVAGVTANVRTRRMEVMADVQYNRSFSWGRESDQDVISGIVAGQYGVSRGLTLNAGALGARVRGDGFAGAATLNNSDSSQVYAAYIGPSYVTRAGDLDIQASYRLGYARVEDDVNAGFAGAPPDGAYTTGVTHDLTGSVGVAPGVWMPLGLVASAGYSREDADQLDQRFEDSWARLDATLPVSPTFALMAGVGYEKIEVSQRSPVIDSGTGLPVVRGGRYVTDENSPRALIYDFDDIIWDVGVLWRPSRRTSLEARVGERYGGMTYSGSFVWQGRNQSFALVVFDAIDSFGRIITSNVAAISGTGLDVVRNPFTGDFTGCAFSSSGGGQCFNDGLTGITGANFRYRGVGAQYAARRGPWGLGIGAGYSQRKFLTPSSDLILVRGTRDENWFGTASLSYVIDNRSSIDGAVYANYFNASGDRLDVLNLGAFTSYYRTVTRNLQASASLGLDSAKADDLDTVINAMGQVGLRYSF